MTDLAVSHASADSAGLTYVCDDGPGIHRRKRGRGFSYELPNGARLTDAAERTWGGTVSAAGALAITRVPETDAHADKEVLAAFDVASSVLGNTRAVCRQSYVQPAVPDAFRTGELADAWASSRATAQLDRIERTVQRLLDD